MQKILLVDDEPLILYCLARTLRNGHIEVKAVSNGSDAIKECSCCFYNLCFLDLHLPDINGIDLMKKIKELSPETKILVMSATCLDSNCKETIEKNAHFFIPKPFELMYVKAIAQQLTENRPAFSHPHACAAPPRAAVANDLRSTVRVAYSKAITFKVICPDNVEVLNQNGYIVDISNAGMGIHTDYPVSPGSVIGCDIAADGKDYKTGIVRNSIPLNSTLYRAGIEFI